MEMNYEEILLGRNRPGFARRYDVDLSPSSPLYVWVPEPAPPHHLVMELHAGLEMGVVLEGRLLLQMEEVEMSLGPGEVWLCAMWEPHVTAVPPPSCTTLGIVFLPEFLGDEHFDGLPWLSLFAASPRERPRVASAQMQKTMLGIAEGIVREIRDKPPAWMSLVRLDILRLLLLLSRGWEPPSREEPQGGVYPGDLARLMPALRLAQVEPAAVVTPEEAAEVCCLSRGHFDALFHRSTGMSFMNYRLRYRLAFAANRLISTHLSLESIASEAGFVDASHLHHAFAKRYGRTPGQYREEARRAGLP